MWYNTFCFFREQDRFLINIEKTGQPAGEQRKMKKRKSLKRTLLTKIIIYVAIIIAGYAAGWGNGCGIWNQG